MRDSVFLKACRREKTPYTPVWLMRQAGRYMKDYRALREKTSFLALCKDAALATGITVTAQKKIGADAAILFSDILLILEPMGAELDYVAGDGPSIANPVRDASAVDALREADSRRSMPFVFETLRACRARLDAGTALIGFAGAPFTLASYLVEGGSTRDFSRTRAFMREDPGRWARLMSKLAEAVAAYLEAQVEAGADALQLFDSWAGALTPEEYKHYALPYSRQVFSRLSGKVPLIHFGTNTGPFLEDFAAAGAEVVGVDHRLRLDEAWQRIGSDKAIQGNLDPRTLLSDIKTVEKEVKRVLSEAGGRPGHVFNLGHGVLPETPLETVIALVDMVKSLSSKGIPV